MWFEGYGADVNEIILSGVSPSDHWLEPSGLRYDVQISKPESSNMVRRMA